MRYVMYAAIVGVGLFVLYMFLKPPVPTSGGSEAGHGPAKSHSPQQLTRPMENLSPSSPSVQANSQEGVSTGCAAFGKQCGGGGPTNIGAAMGTAPVAVGFTTPCQASRNSGKNIPPVSTSPWVKEMFAGSPPVSKPSNPSSVSMVFDHATVQTLDASGPVGFGIAAAPDQPYSPSCSGGKASSQEYAQAKSCMACSM